MSEGRHLHHWRNANSVARNGGGGVPPGRRAHKVVVVLLTILKCSRHHFYLYIRIRDIEGASARENQVSNETCQRLFPLPRRLLTHIDCHRQITHKPHWRRTCSATGLEFLLLPTRLPKQRHPSSSQDAAAGGAPSIN
ncbi:TPA: hypothetical protein QEL15_002442 [Stenotrophomonas maltophilia]|nr:hypothetical protein [Stenotrophomonas maltophilia]